MRCFYCENIFIGEVALSREELFHIFKVNKLKENEKILLNDCKGKTGIAMIKAGQKIIVENIQIHEEPELKIHLFLSPPRKSQLDQIVDQSCEIGIWSIHLLITERSVSIPSKDEKIEKIKDKFIESCKQAHNPFAPTIYSPVPLKDALRDININSWSGCFGSLNKNADEITRVASSSKEIAWIVGPEGGFSTKEEDYLISEGIVPFKIGNCVMRVETAAITGAAILMQMHKRI